MRNECQFVLVRRQHSRQWDGGIREIIMCTLEARTDEQTLLQNHACFPIIIKDNNSYWTQQKHSNNKFDTFWIFNAPFNYMYGKVWAGHLSRPAARCNAVQRCRPTFCNAVPSSSNVGQLLSKVACDVMPTSTSSQRWASLPNVEHCFQRT